MPRTRTPSISTEPSSDTNSNPRVEGYPPQIGPAATLGGRPDWGQLVLVSKTGFSRPAKRPIQTDGSALQSSTPPVSFHKCRPVDTARPRLQAGGDRPPVEPP